MEKNGDGHYEFSLSYDFYYEKLPEAENVEFSIKEKEGRNFITGFTITTENSTKDQAEKIANDKATNLTYLLCISSSRYSDCDLVNSSFQEYDSKVKHLRIGFRAIGDVLLKVEIDKNALSKLESDPIFKQQLARTYRALKSLLSENPEGAIKELYTGLKEIFPSHLKKYMFLRHCLSHDELWDETIENIKKEFGDDYFEFTADKQFDYNSSKNQKNLRDEAWNFLKEVHKILLPGTTH